MPKKTPSDLINSVLRTFPQPDDGFTPNKVLFKPEYTFMDKNAFSMTAEGVPSHGFDTDPIKRSQHHFAEIGKEGWTKNWNIVFQKDHFIEIQQVVDLLAMGPLGQGQWLSAPYEQYLHLSWYLNDQRNTWNIPTSLNIRKGRIQLFQYIHPDQRNSENFEIEAAQLDFLAEYLFCFSQKRKTPFSELIDLCYDMAACAENEVNKLTKYVGERLFDQLVKAYLGWSAAQGDQRYNRADFEDVFNSLLMSALHRWKKQACWSLPLIRLWMACKLLYCVDS